MNAHFHYCHVHFVCSIVKVTHHRRALTAQRGIDRFTAHLALVAVNVTRDQSEHSRLACSAHDARGHPVDASIYRGDAGLLWRLSFTRRSGRAERRAAHLALVDRRWAWTHREG